MDVQTLAPVAAQNLPTDPTASVLPGDAAPPSAGPSGPLPQTLSAGPDQSGASSNATHTLQLPDEVAKIFAGGGSAPISISFQVAHYPNEIVTVFKNSQTGQVITQVPSEIMIKIAEFFDQVAGIVLDKSA